MDASVKRLLEVEQQVSKVIVGKNATIRLAVAAMAAGGHVLLEDVPGTGKTVFAKALAKSVSAGYNRIQFTPDLLPTDITGLSVYRQDKGDFEFKPGPVFTNILLADEINRATPRTQSGLLECMEERQVTADGVTRPLAEPFFVIATQNPVETSGTFPLPEAQLDRFLMKLSMGFPDKTEVVAILNRYLSEDASDRLSRDVEPVADAEVIAQVRSLARKVRAGETVLGYLADVIEATRKRGDIASGVSPRGSLALLRTAQVMALFDDRDYIVPEDIRTLAVPVLAHRIILPHGYGSTALSSDIIREILDSVPVPTETF